MDTPAEELFPQFQRLQSMVSEEVADLTGRSTGLAVRPLGVE